MPQHIVFLAILRGKEEGFLRISLEINDTYALRSLKKLFVKHHLPLSAIIEKCVETAYKHYIFPSIENEFIKLKKTASRY